MAVSFFVDRVDKYPAGQAGKAAEALPSPDGSVAALRASIEREATEFQQRRASARETGTVVAKEIRFGRLDSRTPGFTLAGGEPCFQCGVKRVDHDVLGCKRWRARP